MRLGVLFSAAFLLWGAVATPVKEESVTSVDITEKLACDGSHFIISVQRYQSFIPLYFANIFRIDDVKEDSGALIAEKVSNIVSHFSPRLPHTHRRSWHSLTTRFCRSLISKSIKKQSLSSSMDTH